MSHSYEEIRSATFEVLSGRNSTSCSLDEYCHLKIEVGKALDKYDGLPPKPPSTYPADNALTKEDAETLGEVFWDLFRQGILTLGKDEYNNAFPFFRATSHGRKAVREGDTYFISDTTVFEQRVKSEIPNIDDISILYLKESFQAFRSGCLISSAVMLGVAAEHLFQLLLDQLESDPKQSSKFNSVFQQRTILKKIDKFKDIIAADKASFLQDVRESFDTQFLGIQSIIRIYRNESGHPTGRVIDREQAFVNLRLFIPFGKMVHCLMSHYK
ncbi:MAG TPA: hypothetical protein ACFYD7_03525 [Candidatus Wujingus californicus]|uniref:hypothetical protein n=1 Tax=Candidatus Wujingus californicus TaxID=3367618 RepID=UPI001D604501|nr:hypothetical protein [Planctomycetota bacterium]MDO8131060.1 hypothetical protein [Candidatus Brocadiales bacterium]